MFKAKKTLLVLILFSNVILVFVFGYPVKIYNEKIKDGFTYTKRCFKVGELGQFFRCFEEGKQIRGARLIAEINIKTASLFPFFNFIFFLAIIFSFITLFFI